MKIKNIQIGTICSLLIIASPLVSAHHSSSPHFDSTKPLTIEGVVTEFKFVNPHAYIYLDVTDADGNVANWNCEMTTASTLRRFGWSKDTFKPGTNIKIEGIEARRDPVGCAYQSGELDDGTVLARNGVITAPSGDQVVADEKETQEAAPIAANTFFATWQTAPRRRNAGNRNFAGGAGDQSEPDPLGRYADFVTPEGRIASEAYDQRFDDPALNCSPSSIIRGWSEPGGISEITKEDNNIIIKHEYMDTVRTIHMDSREHPEGSFGLTGHSVGWYEGDVLVIETANFDAGVLFPHPGLVHSEDMVVTERLSLSEEGTLDREYSAVDPQYFSQPITGENTWVLSEIPLSTYDCTELGGINNLRPE